MPLLLLLKPLLERLHQLVKTAQALDQLFLILVEVFLRHAPQPFLRKIANIGGHGTSNSLNAAEVMREHTVEAIDMAFILHQRSTGKIVESLHIIEGQPRIQPLHQGQVLAQRDRHFGSFEL